jgi:hypothetical protein
MLPDTLVQSIINAIPQDYLRNKLKESPLGLAISEETFTSYKPADIVNILRKVADDFTPRGEKLLLFSEQVNPDNSPISSTTTFALNTKKIYASFKNEGVLEKLDKVIIKWTNLTNRKVVYWSAFSVNPNASYNYIFVRLEHWEAGKYLVSMYKQIQDTDAVAYGGFEIK